MDNPYPCDLVIDPTASQHLEAVTVCVGYADFLYETVKQNAQHFKRWVIVTTPEDKQTIELCRRRNLDCVTTRAFYNDGKFNKGRGISLGMNYLSTDCWAIHIDADVVLPTKFRQMIDVAGPVQGFLYGADRVNVTSYDQWLKFLHSGYLHDQHGFHLCCSFPQPANVGTRVIRGRHGYVPIGFFQMFHNSDGIHVGMRYKDYPDCNSDAAHSDIKFALHWDRQWRALLPEIVTVHLESEQCQFGTNWKGRKTKQFGPYPYK